MIDISIEEYEYVDSFYDTESPLWTLFCRMYLSIENISVYRNKKSGAVEWVDVTEKYNLMTSAVFKEQWLSLGHFETFFFIPEENTEIIWQAFAASPTVKLVNKYKITCKLKDAHKMLGMTELYLFRVRKLLEKMRHCGFYTAITLSHDCDLLWIVHVVEAVGSKNSADVE